jgi:hypothetical protein
VADHIAGDSRISNSDYGVPNAEFSASNPQ